MDGKRFGVSWMDCGASSILFDKAQAKAIAADAIIPVSPAKQVSNLPSTPGGVIMHLSANRIRSISRSIARVNTIICGASDKSRRVPPVDMKPAVPANPVSVVKIVAVPKPATA